MSSLRSLILQHSLPLLPTHSFTRQTLSSALSSLPPSSPYYRSSTSDSVIDTVFGTGSTAPAQALVEAWSDEGLKDMAGAGASTSDVRGRLKRRLRYSAVVGEHLVEAYALLASPSTNLSVPIPRLPFPLRSLLTNFRLPPLYSPPGSPSRAPFSDSVPSHSVLDRLSEVSESDGSSIPLMAVNPVGPLSYAFSIAHHAILPDEKASGVVKGLANEPVGSGPEWYTSRVSLTLAYLAAEAQLLQPYPRQTTSDDLATTSMYLLAAEQKLDEHMDRYDQAAKTIQSGEEGASHLMGFAEHLGKTAVGLIRSRGL